MTRRLRAAFTVAWLSAGVALALAAPLAASAQDAKKVDVTGKWLFSVTTDAGTGTPTLTFKQQGDSISGHYSSQLLGEHDLRGTVQGNQIRFSITADVQGQVMAVTYSGSVEADGTLKGSVDFGGYGGGTFTGKKQP